MSHDEVIVVNYTGRRGSGNFLAYEMALALAEKGKFIVPIISSGVENLSIWRETFAETLIIIDTYNNKYEFVINSLLFGLRIAPKIKKRIKNLNVKVVYCPMGTLWSDKINDLFLGAKTIMVIHDPVLHSGTNWFIRMFRRLNKTKYDAIIVHSKKFVNQVKKIRPFDEPVYYFPLGRHNSYKKITHKKSIITYNSELINFIFFGRIEKYKGLDILAEAWDKLDKKYHGLIALSIIGNGDFSVYRSKYEKYSNVTIINRWIEDSEVESVFAGDNLVCVCPYKDGTQSGVISLAMEYGVPIIASDTGGIGEQLLNEKIGLLVKPYDVDELAAAMERVVIDGRLISDMSDNIDEYIGSIGWDKLAEELIKIIEEIL